ncbi:MAG: phosphate acyltransferase PlsX [Alphaproteobacteria bacterium]|nr:phosphate acyltransferase PlsX [Alphaproteobacteria bacterium]
MIKIAIDAMSGDLGVDATIPGLLSYIQKHKDGDVVFEVFGNASVLGNKIPDNCKGIIDIVDTGDKVISGSEKPAHVLRYGRGSSLFESVAFVADGKADVVVSSGNTGAYMALCKILIGTFDEIERPAIVSVIPNTKGKTVMLDLGANTDCSSKKLLQFAIMGKAVADSLLGIKDPKVGLLNIGTEKTKGNDVLAKAYDLMQASKEVNFSGFVEGTDITNGTVDVIVTDGFSGNISLKTMEGTLRYIVHCLKEGFSGSLLSKIGYLLCRKALNKMKHNIDPRNHNGAPLVGLKKIAIKSHGGSDAVGFEHAIEAAVNLAKTSFIKDIERMVLESEKENTDEISSK